jgi:hypothetical protein
VCAPSIGRCERIRGYGRNAARSAARPGGATKPKPRDPPLATGGNQAFTPLPWGTWAGRRERLDRIVW